MDQKNSISSEVARHVAHELKRPLASLQQAVYVLLDEVSGPLTIEQRRILEVQLRNAKRLSRCIAHLTDLWRLDQAISNLQCKNHDLGLLIEEVLDDLRDLSRERQITLQVDLPPERPVVECNGELTSRAISYVVENAILFSPPGELVNIGVQQISQAPSPACPQLVQPTFDDDNAHYAVITVSDCGPGIEPSQREAIFRSFYQIPANSGGYQQGLGIGLTMCKGIIEAHHGAVWVEDNLHAGTRVSLLFPLQAKSQGHMPRINTLATSV